MRYFSSLGEFSSRKWIPEVEVRSWKKEIWLDTLRVARSDRAAVRATAIPQAQSWQAEACPTRISKPVCGVFSSSEFVGLNNGIAAAACGPPHIPTAVSESRAHCLSRRRLHPTKRP